MEHAPLCVNNPKRLLPCPFCGSPAAWRTSTEPDDNELGCSNPDCHLIVFLNGPDEDVEQMAQWWNTRAKEA